MTGQSYGTSYVEERKPSATPHIKFTFYFLETQSETCAIIMFKNDKRTVVIVVDGSIPKPQTDT